MSRRTTTAKSLADDAGLDYDDALVTLWDAGVESVMDIDDRIPTSDLRRARSALGIAGPREMQTLKFWQTRLGLDSEEFRRRLAEMGIAVSTASRVLPKGALSRLRRTYGAKMSGEADETSPPDHHELLPLEPYFDWRTVGAMRGCKHLSAQEICDIHSALEAAFSDTPDPVTPPGVRDYGLLESAAHRPQTSLGGDSKYESAEMVAAALLHSLIHNHAFYNGNKRTALVAMLVSLDRNGLLLTCDQATLFQYVLRVAQHRLIPGHWSSRADREVMLIAEWISANSRSIEKGERAIKWRELRKILTRFDCTFEGPLPGNRMNIRRVVEERKGLLRRPRKRTLLFHAWYGGEGREVHVDHIHSLRRDLWLDADRGIDSRYFYQSDGTAPDEFISEYRNILKRLAKL